MLYHPCVRILGIDPGSRVLGFGCLELRERRASGTGASRIKNAVSLPTGRSALQLVEAGVLRLGSRGPIESRLLTLARGLEELLQRLDPDQLAVEEAFFGKSVQSALRLGEARGVVLLEAARRGVEVAQYPPATIKLRVAGAGGASKEALARMVQATVGASAKGLPLDASDALAVALCHALSLQGGAGLGTRP